MRRLITPLCTALLLSLSGCAKHELPVFGAAFPMSVPVGQDTLGPRLEQSPSGNTVLSWMDRLEDGTTSLTFSRYFDEGWQDPQVVVTELDMFINWADKPAVTPLPDDVLVAHWLRYSAESTYAYDVITALSDDGGKSWSDPRSPHDDGTPTEHGFVTVFANGNDIGILWLDGRKMLNEDDGNPVSSGMALRSATLGSDGDFSNVAVVDELVCECCQTDVAETGKGPVAVYRDRSVGEVRDIFVARQLDGQWQTGAAISDDGWVIEGCPVNGPAIAADGDRVAVAWFTAANGEPMVKTAHSTNAGATFSTPVLVAADNTAGYVGITLVDRTAYVVSWLESGDDNTSNVNLRAITLDGQAGEVTTVGRTNNSRTVPQLQRVGDQLIVAWGNIIGDNSKVATVRVPILGFYER